MSKRERYRIGYVCSVHPAYSYFYANVFAPAQMESTAYAGVQQEADFMGLKTNVPFLLDILHFVISSESHKSGSNCK
jgi:hypothetical protein